MGNNQRKKIRKNLKKLKKTLDKTVKMCYNNYGERERNPKAKYIERGS